MSAALPALREHCDGMRAAIGETLRLVRSSGICRLCGARVGLKHADSCPTWPIIRARAAYSASTERDLFSQEDDGDAPLMMP
jgi:hypothetical protein